LSVSPPTGRRTGLVGDALEGDASKNSHDASLLSELEFRRGY